MFIGLESLKDRNMPDPEFCNLLLSLCISSQLSGLLSDCHMLFQQDGITMIYSTIPPGFIYYQFFTMKTNAVINTVVNSALHTYTRIFL